MPSVDPNALTTSDGVVLAPTSSMVVGNVLGGTFCLEKLLGRGGMGEVWKAQDRVADRSVVLKFVPKKVRNFHAAMDSVRESFKKIHELQHQHICPVYALMDDLEHGLYVVMKYIDGIPLDEYKRRVIAESGKIPFNDIIQILWGIARGLDYAHRKKVIHRDIKPQNIMVSPKDGVQIIDFGLAADIHTADIDKVEMEVLGTRPYMPPEQWRGKYQDAKSDQYALGVTAYELFAGHYPFAGSDVKVLRECVLKEMPEPVPDVPDYVNAALLRALAKNRSERFDSCKTFVRALAENVKTESQSSGTVLNFPVIKLESDTDKSGEKQLTWKPKPSLFDGVRSFFAGQATSRSAATPEPVIKISVSKSGSKSKAPAAEAVVVDVQKAEAIPAPKRGTFRRWFPALLAAGLLLTALVVMAIMKI